MYTGDNAMQVFFLRLTEMYTKSNFWHRYNGLKYTEEYTQHTGIYIVKFMLFSCVKIIL